MNPKPVFHTLDAIIRREWNTRLTLEMEAGKPVTFRGFKARYRVTWTEASGTTRSAGFELIQDGDGIRPAGARP